MQDKWLLYVDDDGVLAPATADFLTKFCSIRAMRFKLLSTVQDLKQTLALLPNSSVRFAVVDLWMNDQNNNTADRTAGFKVISLLRAHSKNCYVVLLSGHIDNAVEARFANERNIAIAHKPTPDEELGDFLDEQLKEMTKHGE